MIRVFLRFILLLLLTFRVNAADNPRWDDVRFHNLKAGQSYEIASGTGFYVNPNYIVTNQHVVENCKNIAVRGAIDSELAALVGYDKNLDLAILYTRSSPERVAYLRINDSQIKYGDILFTVGYPLDRGQTGEYIIQEGTVVKIKRLKKDTIIEFTNKVDHGNSGGPLLDGNANVVGVVKAKKTYFDSANPDNIYNITGVAVGMDSLRAFLEKYGVLYSQNTTYDLFTNYNLDIMTKEYVVNIHCIK